jgi:signal peptidase I
MIEQQNTLVDQLTEPPSASLPAEPGEVEEKERKSVLREYFESAVVTVIMALFGMTFVVQAVKVPTGSMQNNILIGDHLLVNKFIFGSGNTWLDRVLPFREVRRGDIIVFKYPRDPQTNYVKRVIGLPGDRVEIRGTQVYVNGNPLAETRIYAKRPMFDANDSSLQIVSEESVEGANYTVYWEPRESEHEWMTSAIHDGRYGVGSPYTIPEGNYFVMGDNRDDSEDSRFWGTVPRENIVGRALIVYWSFDEKAAQRNGNPLISFLRYTRWSRTGTLIR